MRLTLFQGTSGFGGWIARRGHGAATIVEDTVGQSRQRAPMTIRQVFKSIATSSSGSGRVPLGRDYLIWPTILAAALFLVLVALFAIPGSRPLVLFFGVPVVAIFALITNAISCFLAITSLKERRYPRALSALVLPIVCTIAGLNSAATLKRCVAAANAVQFYVGYPYFAHVVSQLPLNSGPRLAVFPMDGFISMSHGVAFDESDELDLTAGRQTPEWKARVAHTDLRSGDFDAKRIVGHYYLWWSD